MKAADAILYELRPETSGETADRLTDAVVLLFGDRTDLDRCAATAIRWTQSLNGAQFAQMVGRVWSEVGRDAATAITRRCDWAPTRSSRGNPEQLVVERLAGTLEAIGMTVHREVTNAAGRCDLVAEQDGLRLAIEVKPDDNLDGIDQAYRYGRALGMRPVFASPSPGAAVFEKAALLRVAVWDASEPRDIATTVAVWLNSRSAA